MTMRLPAPKLLNLIQERRYGVEYQPLVALADGRVIGYEALARFYASDGGQLSPQQVFDSLHASPLSLFQVEYEMKRLQLAHAPAGDHLLFVNLDPDAFQAGLGEGPHPLVELLSAHPGLVIEIIENSSINDAEISHAMTSAFAGTSVGLALDDIGAPATMLSLPILLTVGFLKFDRSWVCHPDDKMRCAALKHLVAFAHDCGKRTVLEGIEDASQLEFAAALGFDYVQGFLYRPLFHHTGCLAHCASGPAAASACRPCSRAAVSLEGVAPVG
ncbi:EAL domain-containing protein [Azoarcus sp. DN11]|uniref:EAL domain-containing protein n=1 Tax=Azoarcus sp. DN11 TaxID=356837 RepID=UPI000EB15BE7|nr:EAL domain-containing protein [Azoarcus sp. DN11]AYH45829.1 hypothetical protein CDA09_20995 [Azoarcus sp. DN11]